MEVRQIQEALLQEGFMPRIGKAEREWQKLINDRQWYCRILGPNMPYNYYLEIAEVYYVGEAPMLKSGKYRYAYEVNEIDSVIRYIESLTPYEY